MRALLVFLSLALAIYCLVECIQASPRAVRTFPRPVWAVLVVLIPFGGALGWLLAGRPAAPPAAPVPPRAALAPDDDPDFLRSLRHRQVPPPGLPKAPVDPPGQVGPPDPRPSDSEGSDSDDPR